MRKRLLALLTIFMAANLAAHHSNTPFDMSRRLQASGEVVTANFKNPHSLLTLRTGNGETARTTTYEGHSLATLRHYGLQPSMVKQGQQVTISYAPRRDEKPGGIFLVITTVDGQTLDFSHLGYE